MSTLIFGAGAIGQWLGALLFSSGTPVQLHVRPGVAKHLDKYGGVIINDAPPVPVPFSQDLSELEGKQFESVIVTVKTYAVEAALTDLAKAGVSFGNLISFQNGWGTEKHYLSTFPNREIWVATTTRAVGMEGPGRLLPAEKGGLAIAPWSGRAFDGIPNCFKRVKIPLSVLERGIDLKWSKLLLNVIGNATGAVTGLAPPQLADHPRLMKAELQLARETLAVGRALGVRRSDLPGFPVKILSGALEKLPLRIVSPVIAARMRRARGDKLPSLFYDLEEPSRPTELDHMNGAVVAEGQRLGVPTPKQKALVDLFHRCRKDGELWKKLRHEPDLMLEYV